jgi:hypothetical protein
LANFWLKQIKANTYEIEGYKNTIPPRARAHTYEETASTQNPKRYHRYTSSSHHEHIFKKKK